MTSDIAARTPRAPRGNRESHARNYGPGFWVKLILLGLINAIGLYGIYLALAAGHVGLTLMMVAIVVVVDVVYFLPSARAVPMKYLLPGLIFLFVYQIFVIGYTAYTAFTNYGDGHNSTKEVAIASILREHEVRVPDSPTTAISVVDDGESLGFAYVDPAGTAVVGYPNEPFSPAPDAEVSDARVTAVPDAQVLTFAEISNRGREVTDIRVPISADPQAGSMRTADGSRGFLAHSKMEYDENSDTLTNTETGQVFTPNARGNFESADGEIITPGWKVGVGWENFTTIFTGGKLTGEFFGVLTWTVVFALGSVLTTFALGLALAMLFNHPRMKGQRLYRALLILPYAFPGFLSALVWSGMLNQSHGFVNNVLLFGANIPWLLHPFWAKVSILGVNLWLGFPYMLLISMGALQSIDPQVYEAAKIDGASPWRQTRALTLPLLMISTAPLLISSFAFNFNNFNLIYMLTRGGPKDLSSTTGSGVGATDILVTYTYKVAFSGGLQQHGLASAISILIFIIVATISVLSFRQTKRLEEVV